MRDIGTARLSTRRISDLASCPILISLGIFLCTPPYTHGNVNPSHRSSINRDNGIFPSPGAIFMTVSFLLKRRVSNEAGLIRSSVLVSSQSSMYFINLSISSKESSEVSILFLDF